MPAPTRSSSRSRTQPCSSYRSKLGLASTPGTCSSKASEDPPKGGVLCAVTASRDPEPANQERDPRLRGGLRSTLGAESHPRSLAAPRLWPSNPAPGSRALTRGTRAPGPGPGPEGRRPSVCRTTLRSPNRAGKGLAEQQPEAQRWPGKAPFLLEDRMGKRHILDTRLLGNGPPDWPKRQESKTT